MIQARILRFFTMDAAEYMKQLKAAWIFFNFREHNFVRGRDSYFIFIYLKIHNIFIQILCPARNFSR